MKKVASDAVLAGAIFLSKKLKLWQQAQPFAQA
jgi:hypothetical protein